MLEIYKTNCITTIKNLRIFITLIFVIVYHTYQEVTPTYIKNRKNNNKSLTSNSKRITVSLITELMSIDLKNVGLSIVKRFSGELFPNSCNKTRFDRTPNALYRTIELIKHKLTKVIGYNYDFLRIVYNMPIYVCKFDRTSFHIIYRSSATYSKCISKKETFYGFELHSLITFVRYITNFALTSANIDNR